MQSIRSCRNEDLRTGLQGPDLCGSDVEYNIKIITLQMLAYNRGNRCTHTRNSPVKMRNKHRMTSDIFRHLKRLSAYNLRLNPAHSHDFIALVATRCLHLDRIARLFTNQSARNGRSNRDFTRMNIDFLLTNDLIGLFGFRIFID